MKTWSGVANAITKIGSAIGKITPPEPDDQFEALRSDVLKFHEKWGEYISQKITEVAGREE